jgi:NADH-quinone oxidoreductase subunit L
MLPWLWLVPTLPLAGFVVLALWGARLSRTAAAAVGVGSVGLSAAAALGIAAGLFALPEAERVFTQNLWTWFDVAGLTVPFGLHLDALSLLMTVVVTFVGFLIHVYSVEYMRDDASFAKFFAYLNLFVASMLILVLGDNLLLLYLGWEGVGACSYLLIGFWYRDPANDRAARKAFIVTRVGDTAMAVGLLLLVTHLGTLQIQELLHKAQMTWPLGAEHSLATVAALLLLGGAVGKSAQLPLQTWLPDAMAGPTPVSALIHAATMVTAGVYLIARMNGLFALAPTAQLAVGVVGALTLLLAGFSALTQTDIKRVLAYSTISQIGYMFLGLGVGAYAASMFHFFTHAFFKALLFLAAGAVILACHHEQDIRKMGGLRRELPTVFWTFLLGGLALAGFPLIDAGFYSKEWILSAAWHYPVVGPWLWLAGLVGAFLTALYTFRLIFVVFFGPSQRQHALHPVGRFATAPLVVLAFFSVVAGFLQTPSWLGHVFLFNDFLGWVFPTSVEHGGIGTELALGLAASFIVLLGIAAAYRLFGRGQALPAALSGVRAQAVARFWRGGWGFDWLYDRLFVRPFVRIARANQADFVDSFYTGLALVTDALHRLARLTQSGRLRWYAAVLASGAIVLLVVVMWP